VTGQIIITAALALMVFLTVIVIGIKGARGSLL
jgi:F0F1-type ATP synthase membrane subunit a